MVDRAYGALMGDAIQAPDHTTELRDADGRLARIERDPAYPGAVRVQLDATEDDTPYPTQWRLPAVASRPTFYPSDIPFVPHLACRSMQAVGRLYVTWEEDGRPAPDPGLVKQLTDSMPSALKEAVELMKERTDQGEPVGEVSLAQLTEQLGDESSREWMASLTMASQPGERFIAAFDRILAACIEDGWEEDASPEHPPTTARTASLRRGDSQRALVLSSALGIDHLLMTQEPADGSDSS